MVINDGCSCKKNRTENGKNLQPTYGIIDSQTAKTVYKSKEVGRDGNKKIKGRKLHIITDTLGGILSLKVHAANIHDTKMGYKIFEKALKKYPTLKGANGDKGYRKTTKEHIEKVLKKKFDITENPEKGWVLLPKRWIVERTFSWFNWFRRLFKDYELTAFSSENIIAISHSMLLLRRLYS